VLYILNTFTEILLKNLDLFFINLSVYFFAFNLINTTKDKIIKETEEEHKNDFDYTILNVFWNEDDNFADEKNLYFFEKQPKKIITEKNLKISYLYKFGALVETLGILLTMLKSNNNSYIVCLVWITYIILSLALLYLLDCILTNIFTTQHNEIDKARIIKQLIKTKNIKPECLTAYDKNILGKEIYTLNDSHIIIIYSINNNEKFDVFVKRLEKHNIKITLINKYQKFLIIENKNVNLEKIYSFML